MVPRFKRFLLAMMLSISLLILQIGFNANDYFVNRIVSKVFEKSIQEIKQMPTEYPKQSQERLDVMIFSYQRSGSTYVGEIIGHHEDAFYFFEPLWTKELAFKYYRNNYICEMNSLICSSSNTSGVTQTAIKKLMSLYRCEYEQFLNLLYWQKDNRKPQSVPAYSSNENAILQKRCDQSKVRVAKVLRITGDSVEEMIKANPNLKIVYLYRDPRGIINSRLALRYLHNWNMSMGTVKQIAEGLCHKMSLDSEALLHLKNKYPKQIYFVAYEIIAKYPEQSVRQMFKFLGLTISERYMNQISEMGKRTGNFDKLWNSAYRSNGFATSIKWQHEMSSVDKLKIDRLCVDVYNRLGY